MPLLSFAAAAYFFTGTRASWGTADATGRCSGAAPSGLILMPNVKDIVIPYNKTKADITTRLSGATKQYKGTQADVEISIEQVYSNTDTAYLALLGAMLNNATLAMAFLDAPHAAGVEGWWGDWEVLDGEKSEKLDGVEMWTWKIAPGYSAVPVQRVICTG